MQPSPCDGRLTAAARMLEGIAAMLRTGALPDPAAQGVARTELKWITQPGPWIRAASGQEDRWFAVTLSAAAPLNMGSGYRVCRAALETASEDEPRTLDDQLWGPTTVALQNGRANFRLSIRTTSSRTGELFRLRAFLYEENAQGDLERVGAAVSEPFEVSTNKRKRQPDHAKVIPLRLVTLSMITGPIAGGLAMHVVVEGVLSRDHHIRFDLPGTEPVVVKLDCVHNDCVGFFSLPPCPKGAIADADCCVSGSVSIAKSNGEICAGQTSTPFMYYVEGDCQVDEGCKHSHH